MMDWRSGWAAARAAGLLGCANKGDASASSGAAADTAKPTQTAAVTGGAPAAPPPAPPPRKNAPTPEAPRRPGGSMREVTVKGSSALSCETKMVREYLRVSCRGKNDSGGTPTTVKVTRGGREALIFASGGVTSMIIPFVEGIDAEAMFSWTDKSHPLKLSWPRGAPKPTVIGVFEGAKSPLDGTAQTAALEAKLCECHKKTFKRSSCDDMMAGANVDCDRTYGQNCEMLLACSRGEPSAMPTCQAGSTLVYTGHTCAKLCGPGNSCPAGYECTEWGGKMACTEK